MLGTSGGMVLVGAMHIPVSGRPCSYT